MRSRKTITTFALCASVASVIVLAFSSWSASALNATFRIDPSTQTVDPGDQFTVNVVVDADVPLKSIQTDVSIRPGQDRNPVARRGNRLGYGGFPRRRRNPDKGRSRR